MNDPHLATREVLWNISHVWVMYALLIPTVAVAAYGFYRRVRIWRRGQATGNRGGIARGNGSRWC